MSRSIATIPNKAQRFFAAVNSSPAMKIWGALGIGLALLIGIAYLVFHRSDPPVPTSLPAAPASQNGTGFSGSTPQRREDVRRSNEQAADAALQRNASQLPDVEASWRLQEQQRQEAAKRERLRRQEAPPANADLQGRDKAYLVALNSVMAGMVPSFSVSQTLGHDDFERRRSEQQQAQQTSAQNVALSSRQGQPVDSKAGRRPLGLAGQRVTAMTINAAKVDTDSGQQPAIVQMTGGPLAGYRMMGTIEKHENGLTVPLTTLFYTDGPIPVKALLISPQTQDVSVFCDINHHTIERVVVPALVGAVRGLGQAALLSGSSIAAGPFGGAASYSQFSPWQIVGQAAGGAAQGVQSVVQDTMPKGSTVTLCANAAVNVIFLDEVYLPN